MEGPAQSGNGVSRDRKWGEGPNIALPTHAEKPNGMDGVADAAAHSQSAIARGIGRTVVAEPRLGTRDDECPWPIENVPELEEANVEQRTPRPGEPNFTALSNGLRN